MNDRDAAMFQQGVHVMMAYARAAAAQIQSADEDEHDDATQTAIDALSGIAPAADRCSPRRRGLSPRRSRRPWHSSPRSSVTWGSSPARCALVR